MASLEAFDRSVLWAAQGQFADRDIDEAKLSLFQGIDAPVAPGTRGLGEFSNGITDAMRQTK
jgi:Zn-dependent M16 (insulinase) family peptidase